MINYDEFEAKIIKYNLRERWRDGLFAVTEEQKNERESRFYLKAKREFTLMMNSSKNDGSQGYYGWALDESLGTTPTKASYRVSSVPNRGSFIY